MALLFMDGFDHYDSAQGTQGIYAANTNASIVLGTTASFGPGGARTGTHILQVLNLSNIRRQFSNLTRVGIGAAIWRNSLASRMTIFRFYDGASTQLQIRVTDTGHMLVIRRETPYEWELGISDEPWFQPGVWNHIEVWATFSNTVGAVDIRVNEADALNISGVDTCATSNQWCNGVGPCGDQAPSTSRIFFDDLFIADTTGSVNNDFIGDYRVVTLRPNGNTGDADWTPSAGEPFECIDDVRPDDDTTYVTTPTEGDTSTYGLSDLDTGYNDIAGTMSWVRAKKTDAGPAAITAKVISGGTADTVDNNTLTTGYSYYDEIQDVDPHTGIKWTKAAVDAAQLKIERTAP